MHRDELYNFIGRNKVEIKLYYSRKPKVGALIDHHGDQTTAKGFYFIPVESYHDFWPAWNGQVKENPFNRIQKDDFDENYRWNETPKERVIRKFAEKIDSSVIDSIKILEK